MSENIKVSIVEDTESIRHSLQAIIEGSPGYVIAGVYENAEDALEDIPLKKPDVVLMDINLPGMNGIECVKMLKQKKVTSQFLMCTVYEEDEKVFEALKAGAMGYIVKKTPPAQLLEAITDLKNGGSPMSSQIARKVVASFNQKKSRSKEAESLSARENEILDLLAKGFRYKEIAEKLFISTETVRRHVHNIYEKLHVSSRTDAINKVFRNNTLPGLFMTL